MLSISIRLFRPWHVLLALCVSVFGFVSCDSTQSQRINSLTQADPDEQRNRASKRLALASVYFEQEQNEVAQQEVRAALLIDPSYAQAYSLLGLIHQRAQAPELAEQSFEQALKLASSLPSRPAELADVQHNYAWFLCQQNRFEQAQTQFARALSQPGYAQAGKTWMALGLCQIRAGKLVQARNSLGQALAHDAQNPLALYELASLDFQEGNPRRAHGFLSSLNASANASAQSLWLGIRLARALALEQEMQSLSLMLQQQFPNSVQARLLAQKNFDQP